MDVWFGLDILFSYLWLDFGVCWLLADLAAGVGWLAAIPPSISIAQFFCRMTLLQSLSVKIGIAWLIAN